jgi:hypothetical protein
MDLVVTEMTSFNDIPCLRHELGENIFQHIACYLSWAVFAFLAYTSRFQAVIAQLLTAFFKSDLLIFKVGEVEYG